jgi:5'-methylthioadenosine phosphorylase
VASVTIVGIGVKPPGRGAVTVGAKTGPRGARRADGPAAENAGVVRTGISGRASGAATNVETIGTSVAMARSAMGMAIVDAAGEEASSVAVNAKVDGSRSVDDPRGANAEPLPLRTTIDARIEKTRVAGRMSEQVVLGVIGGSGLYEIEGFEGIEEVELSTPFGEPSDAFITGTFGDLRVAFLPRHGRGHRLTPTEINFRANIWGMKALGVTRIVSVSAVGSMREDVKPGDFVVVDQFFDRTRHRPDTFFGDGVVAHVMFADPVCEEMRKELVVAGREAGVPMHDGGTYMNMEGPQFSTRAESRIYRKWGVDVIGMTNLQEARLAREAEICYATIAMATDFDCWHEGHDDVTVENVLEVMRANVGRARTLIRSVLPRLGGRRKCACKDALQYAIMTDPSRIPADARDRLELLIGHHLKS